MLFTLTQPCASCPFRVTGGIRLHPERAREIAENAVSWAGVSFTCHETLMRSGPEEESAEQHCYGSLVLSERLDTPTQIMRIAERLGLYDPAAVRANTAALRHVFPSAAAMIAANAAGERGAPSARVPPRA